MVTNAAHRSSSNPFRWDGLAPIVPQLLPASAGPAPLVRDDAHDEYGGHYGSSTRYRYPRSEPPGNVRPSRSRESTDGRWLKIWEERNDHPSGSPRRERSYEHTHDSSRHHLVNDRRPGDKFHDYRSRYYSEADESRKRRRDDTDDLRQSSSHKRSRHHLNNPDPSSAVSLDAERGLRGNLSSVQRMLWTDSEGDTTLVEPDRWPEEDGAKNSQKISHREDPHTRDPRVGHGLPVQDSLTQGGAIIKVEHLSESGSPLHRTHKVLHTPPSSALLPKKPSTVLPTDGRRAGIDDHHIRKRDFETIDTRSARKIPTSPRHHPKADCDHVSPDSKTTVPTKVNSLEKNYNTCGKHRTIKSSEAQPAEEGLLQENHSPSMQFKSPQNQHRTQGEQFDSTNG